MNKYRYFILLLLLWSQLATASGFCSALFDGQILSSQQVEKLERQSLIEFLSKDTYKETDNQNHPWTHAQLSDPTKHDPQNFKYIIHAKKQGVPTELPADGSTQFISASLISNDYLKAFGRFGYILNVKAENIIATWPVDGQTNRSAPWEYRKTQGVYSPEDLLARAGWFWQNHGQLLKVSIYNEVLLDSGSSQQTVKNKVTIAGLYIILDTPARQAAITAAGSDPVTLGWDGPALSASDIVQAEALARKYNLPLIRITRDAPPEFVDRRAN